MWILKFKIRFGEILGGFLIKVNFRVNWGNNI